jgi:glycerophosphoryl diester phosphodiesterase
MCQKRALLCFFSLTLGCADDRADDQRAAAEPRPCFFSGKVLNIAHRGGSDLAPEHTLLAYQHAIAVSADVLELDVHASSDGELMLMHDYKVDRTTDGSGKIAELSFADLRALDAAFHFRRPGESTYPWRGRGLQIPTLDEVLDAHPQGCFTMEFKSSDHALIDPVIAAFDSRGIADRAVFSSFDDILIQELRARRPDLITSMGMGEMLRFATAEDLDARRRSLGRGTVIQAPWEELTQTMVLDAHTLERLVQPWTVNDPTVMELMISYGVDGIITDDPARLAVILDPSATPPPPP